MFQVHFSTVKPFLKRPSVRMNSEFYLLKSWMNQQGFTFLQIVVNSIKKEITLFCGIENSITLYLNDNELILCRC